MRRNYAVYVSYNSLASVNADEQAASTSRVSQIYLPYVPEHDLEVPMFVPLLVGHLCPGT